MAFTLQYIVSVDQNLIKLVFSSTGLAANAEYYRASNYSISNLSGTTTPLITGVLAQKSDVADYVFLNVSGLVFGNKYKISVVGGKIANRGADLCSASFATWTHTRTKVDDTLANLPALFNTAQGSTFRALLQAMMSEDELIGGSFITHIPI